MAETGTWIGMRSPDGRYWWDGSTWQLVPPPPPQFIGGTPAVSGFPLNGAVGVVGAVAIVVGTLLPWASVTALGFITASVAGTQTSDGVITLGAGIVALLFGLMLLARRTSGPATAGAAVVGLVSIAVSIYDIVNISRVGSNASQGSFSLASVTPGIGLFVVLIGGVLCAVTPFLRPRPRVGTTPSLP